MHLINAKSKINRTLVLLITAHQKSNQKDALEESIYLCIGDLSVKTALTLGEIELTAFTLSRAARQNSSRFLVQFLVLR
jgi:hypothetical protein